MSATTDLQAQIARTQAGVDRVAARVTALEAGQADPNAVSAADAAAATGALSAANDKLDAIAPPTPPAGG